MMKALHKQAKGEKGITINLETIGIKIKQARLRLKKTQQQVADECGISKSLLSKIENGQTSSAVATADEVCPFSIFEDRKSTRLNSSHVAISYAVFCLKKK